MKWAFALIPVLGVLAGCHKAAAPQVAPPRVYTLSVQAASVPLRLQLVGRVSAYQSANVVARVSGVLLERLYREGSPVRQGQPLFQIDPSYYKAQLDHDLAVLAEDRATLANATVTAQRDRLLLPVGSVSQQTVDDANAAERSAAAKVQADGAQIETARLNLGYARVVAPIDGIAGQQQVTVGAIVGSGTSDGGAGGTLLTTIENIDRVYVNFTISATDLLTLRRAQAQGELQRSDRSQSKVAIALPDGSAYAPEGTLDFSGVLVNATTGAVDMRAVVPNPQHVLLPGMYAPITVNLGTRNSVFLVPQQALQRDPQGAYAMVVGRDGKVVRKNVAANDAYNGDWIVTHGLANGDRVIVSGLQDAREGLSVVAQAWTAPAEAGPAAAAE